MREIKFRGWYNKVSRWCYFHVGQPMPDRERAIYNEMCIDGVEWFEFTGLNDKNGKEIFEGDIVKLKDGITVVKWDEYCFCMVMPKQKHLKTPEEYLCNKSVIILQELEIIGNIHEDHELLEHKP